MERTLVYHEKEIKYRLKKNNRSKRLRLAVFCDSSVVVTAPRWISDSKVERFIRENVSWLLDRLAWFRSRPAAASLPGGRRNYLKHKQAARELIQDRLDHFNQFYGLDINRISIKMQKTRWGSCSIRRNLNYNFKILFLTPAQADYIIVHELCHLQEFNHSKRFWSLVGKTIPEYRQRIKEIRQIYLY